jgi:hypothetical protein
MPNGNPRFEQEELPLLESFFARIASVLEDFAGSHNLLIEKYYHDGPAWSFKFKHPVAGIGQIEVEKSDKDSILLRGSWWIDDYDTSTRFMKYPSAKKIGVEHNELRNALENALAEILQWRREELTPFSPPHPWSKGFSRDEFNKQYERFPEPKR